MTEPQRIRGLSGEFVRMLLHEFQCDMKDVDDIAAGTQRNRTRENATLDKLLKARTEYRASFVKDWSLIVAHARLRETLKRRCRETRNTLAASRFGWR